MMIAGIHSLPQIKHLPGLVKQFEEHDIVQLMGFLHIVYIGSHGLDDN